MSVSKRTVATLIKIDSQPSVTMSNALLRAGHGLTLAEKRVIACAISKLDSRRQLPIGEILTTKITAIEYAEIAGCNMRTAYEALQEASKNLFERKITFFNNDLNHQNDSSSKLVQMRWVGEIHYQEGEGWVEIYWWYKIIPFLTGLKRQFTTYKLHQAHALRSVYSWRLMELLMRFHDTKTAEYDIDFFSNAMDATEKQRSNFNNIRRRIIEPAVNELTSKGGWDIKWTPIKSGRRVVKLRFEFKKYNHILKK
ncbi:replication initiation protein [Oecophyllibacter saccharovorans]|uniref:replication initiation protein n=1 Tax=Oecophyllibacter saccharovorans TaxID=2558360 RepID=UPI0019D52790|nr:replication initiation protein [Oecophyllibacter saccharovorans]